MLLRTLCTILEKLWFNVVLNFFANVYDVAVKFPKRPFFPKDWNFLQVPKIEIK